MSDDVKRYAVRHMDLIDKSGALAYGDLDVVLAADYAELEAELAQLRTELAEAVKLLQLWVVYAIKDCIPPGVDIDKSTAIIERFLDRQEAK